MALSICTAMTSGVPPRTSFMASRVIELCSLLPARILAMSTSHSPPGCAARLSARGGVGASGSSNASAPSSWTSISGSQATISVSRGRDFRCHEPGQRMEANRDRCRIGANQMGTDFPHPIELYQILPLRRVGPTSNANAVCLE